MATFKLPLSGDVVQTINPMTWWMSPVGSQIGVINVTLGQSSDPKVEQEVLDEIGTYGKQLGRIGDALIVLLAHFRPEQPLSADETKALDALNEMLGQIAAVKEKHGRAAQRPEFSSAPTASAL